VKPFGIILVRNMSAISIDCYFKNQTPYFNVIVDEMCDDDEIILVSQRLTSMKIHFIFDRYFIIVLANHIKIRFC